MRKLFKSGYLNASQEKLVRALEALYKANQEKKRADARQWELRNDPEALAAFQPEWNRVFHKRTMARQKASALVQQYPSSATDLLERLFARQMEAQNGEE